MPITAELDNINDLEAVGFDHQQAKTITRIIERAQFSGQQDLKEFIRSELDNKINGLRNEFRNEFNVLRNELDTRFTALDNKLSNEIKGVRNELGNEIKGVRNELKLDIANLKTDMANLKFDLLLRIFAIVGGIVGLAVTFLKFFP